MTRVKVQERQVILMHFFFHENEDFHYKGNRYAGNTFVGFMSGTLFPLIKQS